MFRRDALFWLRKIDGIQKAYFILTKKYLNNINILLERLMKKLGLLFIFSLLAGLFISCSSLTPSSTNINNSINQDDMILDISDFFGSWININNGIRTISESEIYNHSDINDQFYRLKINSVTIINNQNAATSIDYPHGFIFSGIITEINWKYFPINVGDHYEEIYFLNNDKQSFSIEGESGPYIYSKN